MAVIVFRVAGVTFEGRQDVIGQMVGSEAMRLIPEPNNPYDENAIGVWVAFPKHHNMAGAVKQVGYVPKDDALFILALTDGEEVMASVKEIVGGFELPDGSQAAWGLRVRVELPEPPAEQVTEGVLMTPDEFAIMSAIKNMGWVEGSTKPAKSSAVLVDDIKSEDDQTNGNDRQ